MPESSSPAARLTRRSILSHAPLGAAGVSAGVFTSLAARPARAANERLQIACIGVANRASANVDGVSGEAIVALCDVDDTYLDRLVKPQGQPGDEKPARFTGARTYHDYRELIDKEAGKVDAVVVSTADHHHVPAAIRAVRKGMHVYCEKPLSHTVAEARLLAAEARKAGVATQLGTQIHAGDNYRRVVEAIRAGTIGDVTDVHVWVGKGWGGGQRPATGEAPPPTLHWDLWLGPAPERPYAAGRYHPAQWRKWWDFGTGTLGDMGCHYMDLPFWALDLDHPTACEAEGPPAHPETCPLGLIVRYDFPARGSRKPVKLTWYDGTLSPKEVTGEQVPGSGVMFVGTDGKMFADYGSYRLLPKEKFAEWKPPAASIPPSLGHYAEWLKACREKTPTTCNFDYSGRLTEAVLLGTVAYRAGRRIEWDGAAGRVTNCPEADRLITKTYRTGWEVA